MVSLFGAGRQLFFFYSSAQHPCCSSFSERSPLSTPPLGTNRTREGTAGTKQRHHRVKRRDQKATSAEDGVCKREQTRVHTGQAGCLTSPCAMSHLGKPDQNGRPAGRRGGGGGGECLLCSLTTRSLASLPLSLFLSVESVCARAAYVVYVGGKIGEQTRPLHHAHTHTHRHIHTYTHTLTGGRFFQVAAGARVAEGVECVYVCGGVRVCVTGELQRTLRDGFRRQPSFFRQRRAIPFAVSPPLSLFSPFSPSRRLPDHSH